MNRQQRERQSQFVGITGADAGVAQRCLEAAGWSVEAAIEIFYSGGMHLQGAQRSGGAPRIDKCAKRRRGGTAACSRCAARLPGRCPLTWPTPAAHPTCHEQGRHPPPVPAVPRRGRGRARRRGRPHWRGGRAAAVRGPGGAARRRGAAGAQVGAWWLASQRVCCRACVGPAPDPSSCIWQAAGQPPARGLSPARPPAAGTWARRRCASTARPSLRGGWPRWRWTRWKGSRPSCPRCAPSYRCRGTSGERLGGGRRCHGAAAGAAAAAAAAACATPYPA